MNIRPARRDEVGIVLQLIHDLAHYEKAPNEVEATEKELLETIFSENPQVFWTGIWEGAIAAPRQNL
jgi:hypothetical protein